jgi:hypothetical protein
VIKALKSSLLAMLLAAALPGSLGAQSCPPKYATFTADGGYRICTLSQTTPGYCYYECVVKY